MKAKIHHITINGEPLCCRPWLLDRAPGVTCDYFSLARAKLGLHELRRHLYIAKARIVKGHCPR